MKVCLKSVRVTMWIKQIKKSLKYRFIRFKSLWRENTSFLYYRADAHFCFEILLLHTYNKTPFPPWAAEVLSRNQSKVIKTAFIYSGQCQNWSWWPNRWPSCHIGSVNTCTHRQYMYTYTKALLHSDYCLRDVREGAEVWIIDGICPINYFNRTD